MGEGSIDMRGRSTAMLLARALAHSRTRERATERGRSDPAPAMAPASVIAAIEQRALALRERNGDGREARALA